MENREYQQLMDERAREALKSRPATQVLEGRASTLGGNLLQPGTLGAPGSFNTFIVTNPFPFTGETLILSIENHRTGAGQASGVESCTNTPERTAGLDP